jgi:hypothetical protein
MKIEINGGWRREAARIVEELFAVTSAEEWDGLLELREVLLRGENLARMLDLFLVCRVRLESDHYLPFYRLRRLIAASLRLEAGLEGRKAGRKAPSLVEWLRGRHRCLADLERRVQREWFEQGEDAATALSLRVVEAV